MLAQGLYVTYETTFSESETTFVHYEESIT